jgi:hypothetical protein
MAAELVKPSIVIAGRKTSGDPEHDYLSGLKTIARDGCARTFGTTRRQRTSGNSSGSSIFARRDGTITYGILSAAYAFLSQYYLLMPQCCDFQPVPSRLFSRDASFTETVRPPNDKRRR